MMDCPVCGYIGGAYITHDCDGTLRDSTGDAPLLPLIARHFDYHFKTPCIEMGEQSEEDMATVRRMQARQAEAVTYVPLEQTRTAWWWKFVPLTGM